MGKTIVGKIKRSRLKTFDDFETFYGKKDTMTGEIYEFHKPNLGPWTKYDGRPDCWNCEHLKVSRFPTRKCFKRPEVYIWAAPYEEDDKERAAETCEYYILRKELGG